ncbi:MAG: L-threonylcarbamoyladenylate synthase [bacterium]
MKIINIAKQSVTEAIAILKQGGVVVYPTETAYALGCDAANSRAKAKIFKIKNRPADKNLPIICATKKMAFDFFKFGKIERKLAKTYWPGPLSIIIKTKKQENKKTRKQEIPVRVSSNKIARTISRGLGKPIISTSANISGKKTLYDAKKIAEIFSRQKNQPDLILDAGKLPEKKPSTIIKIVPRSGIPSRGKNGKIIILRKGEVNPTPPPLGKGR